MSSATEMNRGRVRNSTKLSSWGTADTSTIHPSLPDDANYQLRGTGRPRGARTWHRSVIALPCQAFNTIGLFPAFLSDGELLPGFRWATAADIDAHAHLFAVEEYR